MQCFSEPTKRCHRDFEAWRDQHPNGFVLNRRSPADGMLHRGSCIHLRFKSDEPVLLTRKAKCCSSDRSELESWAKKEGVAVVRCGSCNV